MKTKKDFPEGMEPIGKEKFNFHCHEGVDCYMVCCRNVDMFLYPYDVLRLKETLKITSQEFMESNTHLVKGISHPYFPSVMLRLTEDESKSC
ncbi:MAG TPA: YkgJ family cysteine cluster protein, partial [Desulfobacterales bacterium]|nr:YkgJ family cysteine cluster protein [Desulfobacterales bacterium]